MRYPVIDRLLVRVGFCIGLANTFSNHFGKTVLVTSIFAVLALHTRGILEEFSTERASHDAVELLREELVAVLLHDLLFALPNGTFSP